MVPGPRSQRRVRGVALLLVCLGLMALLPGGQVGAQSTVAQPIDNTQGDYSNGVFQRTSIGPDVTTIQPTDPISPIDKEGVVQLAPAGVLKAWDPVPNTLPAAVSGHGVTALGSRIYAIGGAVAGGYSDAAYWATVDPTTGALKETAPGNNQYWTTSTMAAAQLMTETDSSVPIGCRAAVPSKRTNVGVASVATGANTGYIYVVGGTIAIPGIGCEQNISTPTVQRGTVAANGTITWSGAISFVPSPPVPTDTGAGVSDRTVGVEGASVVIANTRTAAGVAHYYLYVIGGRSVYTDIINGGGTLQRVLNTVFYTEINIATGGLKNPSTGSTTSVWVRGVNIPQVSPPAVGEGLWNATASATSVEVGNELKTAIFLSGGAYDVDGSTLKISPYVYRASVNSSTGALTWSSAPGEGGSQVTLAGRRGMTSLLYANKLYAIGGRTTVDSSSALDTVPTAFLDDDLTVIKVGGTDFFVGTDPVSDRVLGSQGTGRFNSGAALVRAQPPANVPAGTTISSAWAYVIGGTNNLGNSTNSVFLGKIGGEDANATVRAPEGWYYSSVIKTAFEVGTQNKLARVLSVNWAADLGRAFNPKADIRLEFRKAITASGECPDDSVFTSSTDDRWRPVDGDTASASFFSKPAATGALFNKVNMSDVFGSEQINATCFQYRAHLLQNGVDGTGPTSRGNSPKLLEIYLEKVIAGNADLRVPTNGFVLTTSPTNRITSFVVKLQNLSDKGLSETLSVDDARIPNAEGSFYVNLCRAYSATASPSLTLPVPKDFTNADKVKCPAYAEILTSEMGKGTTLDLRLPTRSDGQSRWYSNLNGGAPIANILDLFSTPGYYRIGLVIDTYDFVPEGTAGEANNRFETTAQPGGTTIAFRVEGTPDVRDPNDIILPLIRR